jgi:hypothetical protein
MTRAAWWEPGGLEAWRSVGDPLADSVVDVLAELDEQPQMESSIGFVERLAFEGKLEKPKLRVLRTFLETSAEVPEWVDWQAIERAQTFFVRFGLVHSTALLLGGLLESYSDTQIANVLMRTGRLHKGTYRRIFETGSMVYDTMIPGGLVEGRKGYRTLLKVRLMHAGVRRLMLRGKGWDLEQFGVPVGQEDMAFTLLMFDVATLNGAQRLGLRVSTQQREDHHHLWRYVGYLMGVDPELLPSTASEAEALHRAISKRQRHDSKNGRALTDGMVDALSSRAPFFLPREGLSALCYRLLGPELGRYLGLKNAVKWHLLFQAAVPALRAVQKSAETNELIGRSLERMAIQWGEWAISEGLGDEPARFPIPGIMR